MENHWLPLLQGLLGILIGVLTYRAPELTALGLLIYIAAWSLATGVLEIVAAIELRKVIKGEFWLLMSGICSIIFAMIQNAKGERRSLAITERRGVAAE